MNHDETSTTINLSTIWNRHSLSLGLVNHCQTPLRAIIRCHYPRLVVTNVDHHHWFIVGCELWAIVNLIDLYWLSMNRHIFFFSVGDWSLQYQEIKFMINHCCKRCWSICSKANPFAMIVDECRIFAIPNHRFVSHPWRGAGQTIASCGLMVVQLLPRISVGKQAAIITRQPWVGNGCSTRISHL